MVNAKSWCKMHYERHRTTGSTEAPTKPPRPTQCRLDGCESPRYQGHFYCGSHYMKIYRRGDANYNYQVPHIDLIGERFGMLEVLRRVPGKWLCKCDCGEMTTVSAGNLNRSTAASCGDKKHTRTELAGYSAAHYRVYKDRGRASSYSCVDCGHPAMEWSYDHTDPREQTGAGLGANGLAFSLDPVHYSPRCLLCHKRFDLSPWLWAALEPKS